MRFVCTLLVFLFAGPAVAAEIDFKSFGFRIQVPAGWSIHTKDDDRRNLDGKDPILIATRYREPYDGLNTAIIIRIMRQRCRVTNRVGDLANYLAYRRTVARNFRLVERPNAARFGELSGVTAVYTFRERFASGNQYNIRARLDDLYSEGYVLYANITSPTKVDGAVKVAEKAAGTVRFYRDAPPPKRPCAPR